jgi:hypothetical protein
MLESGSLDLNIYIYKGGAKKTKAKKARLYLRDLSKAKKAHQIWHIFSMECSRAEVPRLKKQ